MALTLGDLRTFCAETASPDANSAAADREFMLWINFALSRLWSEHDWTHARSVRKVILAPEESGSAMTVTQGSRTITLTGETFAEKYLTDGWRLNVTGEQRMLFRLASIESPTSATLAEDELWIQATSAAASYTWSRYHYPLPEDAWRVTRVENVQSLGCVMHLEPDAFDSERSIGQNSRSGHPLCYTIRNSQLEVWPGPGSDYVPLEVTYTRKAPRYSVSDPSERTVDWPESKSELLYRAIMLEASVTQGEASPVPYGLASREYERTLEAHRGTDSNASALTGPMSLGRGLGQNPMGWAKVQ